MCDAMLTHDLHIGAGLRRRFGHIPYQSYRPYLGCGNIRQHQDYQPSICHEGTDHAWESRLTGSSRVSLKEDSTKLERVFLTPSHDWMRDNSCSNEDVSVVRTFST